MDTSTDHTEACRTADLNLTDDNFLAWLRYNASVSVSFLDGCYPLNRELILGQLKEMFWEDFAADMELSYDARREVNG